MKKIILILLFSVGCVFANITPYFGLAMNMEQFQDNGVKSESPLGLFGVAYETEFTTTQYRHISSIPQIDETQGINEIGFNLKYKISFITPYVGMYYNDEKLTSNYYLKQIPTYSKVIGFEINYNFGDIIIEYRPTDKNNFIFGGAVIKFDPSQLDLK